MDKSDKLNIYQRILEVMREVDYIQKGPKKAGGIYTFVSHDLVAEKIHPQLVKHGIVAIPTVKSLNQKDTRTEVCLTVRFINVDVPTDFFEIDAWGYGIDPQDKGPGKAVSYAFKYAMLKTFCLETGDDPDNDQVVVLPNKEPRIAPEEACITPTDAEMLIYLTKDDKEYSKNLLSYHKIESFYKLPKTRLEATLKSIHRRKDESIARGSPPDVPLA